MDVEKTIQFILEQQAHITALQTKAEERAARQTRRSPNSTR
ncbi:MAG: hypothetical protein ABSH32_07500 [Bryobacteraceae bacterium]|jgi:hypothetical protein